MRNPKPPKKLSQAQIAKLTVEEQKAYFEAILASEGLAPLDQGDLIRSKGSGGRPTGDIETMLLRRERKELEITYRQDILRSHKFTNRLEKTIWSLYAEGLGTLRISKLVHKDHTTVRTIIKSIRTAFREQQAKPVSIKRLISNCDLDFLADLLNLLNTKGH